MRHSLFVLLALGSACQKPEAQGEAGKGAPAAPPADPGGVPPVPAAAITLTECPKSLGGNESKVHRVISRECGAVLVADTYQLDDGSLTLEAGASLQFKDGAGLIIGANEPATLVLKGTADAPVVLTSAGDKAAGAWLGVELRAKAARSSLEHAVIEYGGDAGRALLVAAPEVRVTDTKIRSAPGVGVRVADEGGFAAFTGNTLSKLGDKLAMALPPGAVAGIGAGNRFDGGAAIHVLGGTLAKSATWAKLGAPIVVTEEIAIDGADGQRATLELAPGTELRFAAEARLVVGAHAVGGLRATGTAEAPITFTAHEQRAAGAWSGVRVGVHGELALQHAALEFGGREDDRGVLALDGGTVSVQHTMFRSNRAGVTLAGEGKLTAFADNTFAATPLALVLPPAQVGALGENNAFDRDAQIVVEGGALAGKATWLAQGAPLVLSESVTVDGGELTLDAGLQVLARPDAALRVGEFEPATLVARGTVGAPITFGPAAAAGTWPGIKLFGKARGNVLEHVVMTAAGDQPGVWAAAGAEASLSDVTCARCRAAVVGWECGAKLTSSVVLAADGTPAIEAAPTGC